MGAGPGNTITVGTAHNKAVAGSKTVWGASDGSFAAINVGDTLVVTLAGVEVPAVVQSLSLGTNPDSLTVSTQFSASQALRDIKYFLVRTTHTQEQCLMQRTTLSDEAPSLALPHCFLDLECALSL